MSTSAMKDAEISSFGDGIEQDSQCGHLKPPTRKVAIGPIRGRSSKQDQDAPEFEAHVEAP